MKKLLLILLIVNCSLQVVNSQWQKQTIPVNKPISGIKFIDSLKGWACTSISTLGDTSFIINTTNGGINWNIQYTAPNIFLNSLFVINNSIGYVGGYDGGNNINMLLKTTNSGLNWVNKNPPSVPFDLFFINQDSGWYCDNFLGPDVRTTTDGGTTWQLRNSGLTDNINRLFFLNYSTGWAGSTYFKKTTNAGLNWVQIYDFATDIYSLYFINELTGWVGLSNNRIRYTTNGGFNWTEQTISPPSGPIYELYFINNNTGWAGVTADYIFKTTNGGVNWGYQYDTTGSREFCFIDSSIGWSGYLATGHISKTTNGGGPITYVGINNISTEIPESFKLYQNFPNPFNPVTNINFDIKTKSLLRLVVFDLLGRVVKDLVNETLPAGSYNYVFTGNNLSSGLYFYRLITDNFTDTKKMILIK